MDADKQNKLDKLFQEVYNMGVTEGYNKQVNEECREKKLFWLTFINSKYFVVSKTLFNFALSN